MVGCACAPRCAVWYIGFCIDHLFSIDILIKCIQPAFKGSKFHLLEHHEPTTTSTPYGTGVS